jgi:hypothetical protein
VKRDLPSWARRKLEVPPTDLVGWADWVTKITHDHARETRRRGGLDPLLFVHNAAGLVGIMFGLGPYLDDEEGKEKLGRLLDDAMRVMMGHPTGMEVRKAIVVMSSPGAETRELMDKAFRLVAEREGLDADVVRGIMGDVEGVATPEELERLLLLTAKELVQDEAFRVVMEREFEEHAGPIGPIRGGGQSGFSL